MKKSTQRRSDRRLAAFSLGVLAAGFVACAGPPAPRDHFYRIEVVAPAAGGAQLPGILEVERMGSDGTLRDRAMLKTLPGSPEVTPYAYHRWTDSPTLLLQRALADYLRSAAVAESVVTPDAGATEDWQVNGYLRRLDHVIAATPSVRVELELRMRRLDGEDLVEQRIYAAQGIPDDASLEAAARAFSVAIGEIFAEFTNDLRAAASAR